MTTQFGTVSLCVHTKRELAKEARDHQMLVGSCLWTRRRFIDAAAAVFFFFAIVTKFW